MADRYDGVTVGDFVTERFAEDTGLIDSNSFRNLYEFSPAPSKNAQDEGVKNVGDSDNSNVYEVVEIGSLPIGSVQLQVLNEEGTSEDVSMGFGLGIRQHNDVMLAWGHSKHVEREMTLSAGQFMILRLDTGDVSAHHAENRTISITGGSAKLYVIEVDDPSEFPAIPISLNIVNNKGPEIEVSPNASFFGYIAQASNPFTMNKVFDEIPLYGTVGGFFTASSVELFQSVIGRHYTKETTYAVLIEATDAISLYYRYNWHDYK